MDGAPAMVMEARVPPDTQPYLRPYEVCGVLGLVGFPSRMPWDVFFEFGFKVACSGPAGAGLSVHQGL